MKTMIISDIHGYSKNLKKVLEVFQKEQCRELIVLGDLLTPGRDEEEVIELLNKYAFNIICIRGNNDTYIYGSLMFNLIDNILKYNLDNNICYLTHGHRFNKDNENFLKTGEILIQGHTHISDLSFKNGKYYINPGSISLPRDNTDGSYIIYENNIFYLYDIDNNLIDSLKIK